jgi:hypothetical protein
MSFSFVPVCPFGAVTATFLYGTVNGSTNNTNIPLGDEDANRRIVVFAGNGSVSGMTVGGATASIIDSASNVTNTGYVLVAHVPTGTTGTIAITGSGTFKLAVYAVYEAQSNTPADFAAVAGDSLSVEAPANGVIMAARFIAAASGTSWSSLDEDYDQNSGVIGSASSAHREFTSGQTSYGITGSGGTLTFPVTLAISFGL